MGAKLLNEGENDVLTVYLTAKDPMYIGLYLNDAELDESSLLPAAAAWQATTAYSEGDKVQPVTPNGFVYECTVAGTSDSGEPSWPVVLTNTVVDGTVTWTCTYTTPLEPSGNGYAREDITFAECSVVDDLATYAQKTFHATGSWGDVYGYFIADSNDNSGKILLEELFSDGPYSVSQDGDEVRITAKIRGV